MTSSEFESHYTCARPPKSSSASYSEYKACHTAFCLCGFIWVFIDGAHTYLYGVLQTLVGGGLSLAHVMKAHPEVHTGTSMMNRQS